MAVGSDPQVTEDLFTKIALENKLVTKYQLRKASEEQERLEGEGQPAELGLVLIQLGFLSERQHQSVLNACTYRTQRDYDKRFGRQCMRMELLDQAKIEEALSTQKAEYMKSGTVRPLAEILEEEGTLDPADLQRVVDGIRDRDRARAAARSGKNPALDVSATVPVARKTAAEAELDSDEGALEADDDADADLDDDEDLDDVDLDEEDDDEDLDDVDLDEEDDDDLDDEDLDDEDLDDDDEASAEVAAAAAAAADVDLDDVDLDDDDDDVDIDDLDDEGPEHEEATSKSASAIDINIDDVDIDDDDVDEDDLAEVVSEVDSDVRLDDDHLRDLEQLGSAEEAEEEEETAAWTADAFDDRPLDKRSSSERQLPPEPQPLPATEADPPAAPPQVPRAAGSSRLKPALPARPEEEDAATIVAGVPSSLGPIDRDEGSFPGSDVFEAGVSDLGQIADLDDDDDDDDEAPTSRGQVASTASDLSPVLEEPEEAPAPAKTPGPATGARDSEVHFGPRALARLATQAAEQAKRDQAPPPAASARALPRDWRDDPRLRMAFEKALQAAWDVFVQELDRGEG